MDIKWLSFLQVALATFLASSSIVLFYGLGVRFLARSTQLIEEGRSGLGAKTIAWVFFALVAVAVLFGIYLIVPAFSGR